MTNEERASLLIRYEALIGMIEFKATKAYKRNLIRSLGSILSAIEESEGLTDLQRRRAVKKAIDSELKEVFATLQKDTLFGMTETAAAITVFTAKILDATSPISHVLKFTPDTLLQDGYSLGGMIGSNKQTVINRFNVIVAEGITEGKHSRTMYRELKKTADKSIKHVSQILVTSAVARAKTDGMLDSFKRLEQQGIEMTYQWLATLELNTCIAKGQPVNLANGCTKSIEDVSIGDEIVTHTGAVAKVDGVMLMGNKEVIEVEFEDGRTITGTADHLVWDGDEWVRLDEVTHIDG